MMKKLFKVFFAVTLSGIAAGSVGMYAQDGGVEIKREAQSYYYVEVCEATLRAGGFSLAKSVSINFGKDAPAATSYRISDEKETGVVDFENALTALNYLGAQGWEVVSAYKRDVSNPQMYYLLRIDISKHKPTLLTRTIDDMLSSLTIQELK